MKIKKAVENLFVAYKRLVFGMLKIKSIKNEDLFMVSWIYTLAQFLYGFYFIVNGKFRADYICFGICSLVSFGALVVIGIKAGTKHLHKEKIRFYFNLSESEAIGLSNIIQFAVNSGVAQNNEAVFGEVSRILASVKGEGSR